MDDERDAEDAIRALHRTEFGRKGRRLRVEWTKQEQHGGRKSVVSSRSAKQQRPSKTLFVINFPYDTRTTDLERHFDPYGKIVNVRIRKNFAFIQYESQEDATRALDATNMSKLMDRVISVEYSDRGDDERRNDQRGRDRSPGRGRRSPSPYRRERESPDYGHGSSPGPCRKQRGSPDYGHGPSRGPRLGLRRSPDYGRGTSSSPPRDERTSTGYRNRSLSPRNNDRASPVYRDRSESPYGERAGNGYNRRPRLSPYQREEASPGYSRRPISPTNQADQYRSRSPPARE